MRTQEEILARIESIGGMDDFFGAQREELIVALTFENAKPYLVEDADPDKWEQHTPERSLAAAMAYLSFAIDKADGHRGLSANRSIDHFRGWVWLLTDDEKFEEWESTDYANYGAPMLKAAAEVLGFPEEWDRLVAEDSDVARMAEGKQCDPEGCYEGCS